jgi:hypothetical protein
MPGERVFDPAKTPGTFGAPPEGAPQESALPLTGAAIAEMAAKARANEQVLPPFAPEKRMGVPPPTTLHAKPRELSVSHQPAASNTDSPSRGVPQPISDPGKVITGGWGPALEAQYFPLDGSELRELVRMLLDKLNERIQNDMRFHPAITYPRVKATLQLVIEGFRAEEQGFEIQYVAAHDKTKLEVAKQLAQEVVFVVQEMRREVTEDGTAENPPDRVRDELELPKPHKHQVEGPGGRKAWVDVEPDQLQNIF